MTNATIAITDLLILLEVAEGYTSENGVEAVGRYAVPEDVERAIINAKVAVARPDRGLV